ncbi:MAG: hypothetical protein WD052_10705, partial [Bacteroidales bacterium]
YLKTTMKKKSNRIDRIYRNAMLVVGILATLLFLFSLIALIEFPEAFTVIALSMAGSTILFFLLRSIYHFRNTFRVKTKNKATRK